MPRQNDHHFADGIFKCFSINKNCHILIWISLKCVPRHPVNNISALIQMMHHVQMCMFTALQGNICIEGHFFIHNVDIYFNNVFHNCKNLHNCFIIYCYYYHYHHHYYGHNHIPRFNEVERGGVLVSPCPSFRLWTESCRLCIFNNTCRIHFIFAHLIKQLQKVCCV